jgi:putative aldouronate transport system substrate-binding protein
MSNQLNRRQFLKLAGTAVLSSVVTACAKQAPAATSTSAPNAVPTSAPTVAPTSAPTAVPTATSLPPVELRVLFPASPVPEDTSPFDRLNEITKAKFNTTVNYEILDWSVYGDKQSMYHASGEGVDIEFAAPWLPEAFNNAAANGVYTPLDDLLPKYAPGIWARTVPDWWRAVTVNGKIYAVINEQYFPAPWGILVRADMLEKYNINLDAITAYDSEELFKLLHALGDADKENLDYPWAQLSPSNIEIWGYDAIAVMGSSVAAVVNYDDKTRKVGNWHETPEYMRYARLMKRLSDEGLSNHDPLKIQHDQKVALITEGKLRFEMVQNVRPGIEERFAADASYNGGDEGWTWKGKVLATVRLATGNVSATLLTIPVTSKNPERAMMFMDLLGSDENFFNLLSYGVEGTHWNWSDKGKKLVKRVEDSKYDLHAWGWMYVNQFLEYACEGDWPTVGLWDICGHQQNLDTPSSVMMGFVPNPKEYEDKSTLLASGGADAFVQKIDSADGDPEKNVADLIAWEKDNGVDEVVTKLQKQVDDWAKTFA